MIRLLQLFKHLHICTLGAHALPRRSPRPGCAKEDARGLVQQARAAATMHVIAT